MNKSDLSEFNADELNQAIDDTNFPHTNNLSSTSASTTMADQENNATEGLNGHKTPSIPLPIKQNGIFSKSFSDDVFDVPKTPRSLTTPGNCE